MYKSDSIKIKKSKRHLLAISVVAAVFMLAMNTNIWNANASIFSDIRNVDDVGQSLECVIIVVGCDGTGSVGSSGDVIIGTDDNNTNGNGETPINPDHDQCALCLTQSMNPTQISILATLIGLSADASLEEICEALEDSTRAELTLDITTGVGLAPEFAVTIINCLIEAGYTNLA